MKPRPFLALLVLWATAAGDRSATAASFAEVVAEVQPGIVKIFGAGGIRRLEHYQSGILISPEGHVLTVWSYVLDVDAISVVLNDGRKFQADLVGADPRLEIAVLKIDVTDVAFFDLDASVTLKPGDRVLAFSNLFGVAVGDEQASVQHGHVSGVAPLSARRGAYETPYDGTAYFLDAMTNNPGAAGGALTSRSGRLAGLLGKELRNRQDNTWLNYALPISELNSAVQDILAGRVPRRTDRQRASRPAEPITLKLLGITLVPNVLAKTPPFIEQIDPGSPAAQAGLKEDDLLLFVNGRVVSSIAALRDELSFIDRIDEVRLTVQRKLDLVEVSLFAPIE